MANHVKRSNDHMHTDGIQKEELPDQDKRDSKRARPEPVKGGLLHLITGASSYYAVQPKWLISVRSKAK
jgi:hypothetical protein